MRRAVVVLLLLIANAYFAGDQRVDSGASASLDAAASTEVSAALRTPEPSDEPDSIAIASSSPATRSVCRTHDRTLRLDMSANGNAAFATGLDDDINTQELL